MIIVVACDPGGRDTGIVVRSGDVALDHVIITSTSPPKVAAGIDYAHDVVDALVAFETHFQGLGHTVHMGVESLVTPSTQRGAKWGDEAVRISPVGLMGAAMVYGSVATAFRGHIYLVRPGGHGSQMLRFYPPTLVGPREKGPYGGGQLRHCRSAWDVAGQVARVIRHPELRGT